MSKKERRSLKDRYKEDYNTKDLGGRQSPNIFDLSEYADVEWYSIKEGVNKLDIIPYEVKTNNHPQKVPRGDLDYKLDIWVHRFVGPADESYLCLKKTFGKRCPICDEIQKMLDSEDYTWKDDAVKALKAKRRCLYNVIDVNGDDEKILLFEISHFEFQKEIIEEAEESASSEGEFVAFADLEDGSTIKFRGSAREGEFKNTFQPKSYKFIDREPYGEDILDEVYPLDALLRIPTVEEIEKSFFGKDEEEDEKPSKRKPSKIHREKDEEDEDIDDDFKRAIDSDDDDEEEDEKPSKSKGKSKSKNKCPGGGSFGDDCDELDECEDCDLWENCSKEFEKKDDDDSDDEEEEDEKPAKKKSSKSKPEEKKKSRKRGVSRKK